MYKSRQVLIWTVVKSAISLRLQEDKQGEGNPIEFAYMRDYPGISKFKTMHCIGLPYYIPILLENPGWKPPPLPAKNSELLEQALVIAKENDDFKTQTVC